MADKQPQQQQQRGRMPDKQQQRVVVDGTNAKIYPLPKAIQTHEIAFMDSSGILVVSQQTSNSLIALSLDVLEGYPLGMLKLAVPWAAGQGPHGLCVSKRYPGKLWITLQFGNQLMLGGLDPTASILSASRIIQIPVPACGPHCLVEDGRDLWITCKDSCHLVRLSTGDNGFDIYKTSARPMSVILSATRKLQRQRIQATVYLGRSARRPAREPRSMAR